MAVRTGTVIAPDEYRGAAPGFLQPVAYVLLDDGEGTDAYTYAVANALDRSQATGPDGTDLRPIDLKPGVHVVVDVRKGQIDKFLSAEYPNEVAEKIRSQDRAAAQEKDLQRQHEEVEKRRQRAYARDGSTNPYTFLPFLSHRPDDGRFLSKPAHRTNPPDGRLSGRVRLRLTIATPLATYGGSEWAAISHKPDSTGDGFDYIPAPGTKDHRKTSLLRDAEGRPTLTGASIKGALRSWYEVITSSHRPIDPSGVAWRDPAIEESARSAGIIRLYRGRDGERERLPSLKADDDRELPADVHAVIVPVTAIVPPVTTLNASIREKGEERLADVLRRWRPVAAERNELRHGMRLEPKNGQDPPGWLQLGVGVGGRPAVGVRVLPDPRNDDSEELGIAAPGAFEVPRDGLERWWEAHRRGGANGNRARVDVNGTTWTCVPPDATLLEDGVPVFFERSAGGEMRYLSVVRGGRWAIRHIPDSRLPKGRLPDDDDRLDPARRTFGRVPASSDVGSAWAGRIRVSNIRYEGEGTTDRFTLLPLQSPKVQAAGFYLQGTAPEAPVGWRHDHDGHLAGTKFYWHQVPIPDPDGTVEDLAVRVRHAGVAKGTDGRPAMMGSNSTVEALLDGSFQMDIWFEDLDDSELDALLLSLSLEFGSGDERRGYKLGLGKPLGLGSVVNEIVSVDLTPPNGPTSLAFEPLSRDDIRERLAAGRAYWIGEGKNDLAVLDGIARLDAVQDRSFGYPPTGRRSRRPGRDPSAFLAEPKAADVLHQP